MSELPEDLRTIEAAIDAADAAADALAARVNDEEFFWQPDGGRRWSIALCLDHLAVADAVYGAAMREAVDRARAAGWTRQGPGAPGFFGRKFIASLEPPVTRRMSAPRKITPRPAAGRPAILEAYHEAHADLRRLVADAASIDINRATFANPFIPLVRVRVSTGLSIIAAHDRRHLWQAEQVEKALRSRR
jgi:hypothetical protein